MATQVTLAGTYEIQTAARCLVRNESGDMYLIAIRTDGINKLVSLKSSDNGDTWAEQDAGNAPSNARIIAYAACIDEDGVIRIPYIYNKSGVNSYALRYVEFDTVSDVWQNDVQAFVMLMGAINTITNLSLACAIRLDRLQVAFSDGTSSRAGVVQHIRYTNRTSLGMWAASILVRVNASYPDILIEEILNRPVISVVRTGVADVSIAFLGNSENAASFMSSPNLMLHGYTAGIYSQPSIAQCAKNIIWVVSPNASGNAQIRGHNSGDAWNNWRAAVTIEAGDVNDYDALALATRGYAKFMADKHVFGVDTKVGDLNYYNDFNQFQTDDWTTAIQVDANTDCEQVKLKWANDHNHGGTLRVDFVYIRAGDVWYDYVDLHQVI